MSNENIEIVKKCYQAFGRGDIAGFMTFMSDDLTRFGINARAKTSVPWYASFTKKSEVPGFFDALGSAVEHTKFELLHFAAAGDYVYASIKIEFTIRKSSRSVDLGEVIHRIKLKGGSRGVARIRRHGHDRRRVPLVSVDRIH